MGVINPIRLLVLSIIIWMFFYIQMPVTYLYSGSAFFPIITLVLFNICFVFGIISLKRSSIKTIDKPQDSRLKKIIMILFFLGLIGVLLKVYVGFFKTEIFVAEDVFEQRLENMGKELTGGPIGVVASLFFPFAYVALLMAIYNYKIFSKPFLLLVFLSGLYPMVETVFMGGRTIIALLGTTLIFVLYASYNKNATSPLLKIKFSKINLVSLPKILFKKTVLIPLILISVLFISYSINVVNKRLTRFNYGTKTIKIWEKKDYQWVKFNNDFKEDYFSASKDDRAKLIGMYSLKHYFAHGVIEYIRLVNQLDKKTGYYYGQFQFNVFFKFFKVFGVPFKSMKELKSVIIRKAVYQTFWGPFYLDFGVFGFVIIFFWGRFVKRVYVHSRNGSIQYVVFYGFLSTLIITSSFINFLLGASSYYLFAFFVSLLIFKLTSMKFVVNANQ